jgi:hypothetical protein
MTATMALCMLLQYQTAYAYFSADMGTDFRSMPGGGISVIEPKYLEPLGRAGLATTSGRQWWLTPEGKDAAEETCHPKQEVPVG